MLLTLDFHKIQAFSTGSKSYLTFGIIVVPHRGKSPLNNTKYILSFNTKACSFMSTVLNKL